MDSATPDRAQVMHPCLSIQVGNRILVQGGDDEIFASTLFTDARMRQDVENAYRRPTHYD